MVQKVTHELDQMYIEDGDEGNEEVEYVELVEVPDLENVSENVLENASENALENAIEVLDNPTQKKQIQSKITSFFSGKK